MTIEKHQDILKYIIDLTEQRDSELLQISLIKTMYDLFNLEKVFFCRNKKYSSTVDSIIRIDNNGIATLKKESEFETVKIELENIISMAVEKGSYINFQIGNRDITAHPVYVENIIIGFIVLYHAENEKIDTRIISGLIRIYHNYMTLLAENQKDKLTNLLNRKTFDDQIIKIIDYKRNEENSIEPSDSKRDAKMPKPMFWLGIIDIDNFKNVNDTFGHIYGDEVLIIIANLMIKNFRSEDLIFRFGGEEFITIIQTSSKEEALSIFDRFRISVQEYPFPRLEKITVSIGMVQINTEDVPTSFVGHADQALYHSKKNGKNRISIYEELIKEGLLKDHINYGKIEIF